MITRIFRSAITFFNAVSSEVEYWKQIEAVQIERDLISRQLANEVDENEFLDKENSTLKAENSELKDELKTSNIAYQSLLSDYYQMMDKHREFKRTLAESHRVSVKSL